MLQTALVWSACCVIAHIPPLSWTALKQRGVDPVRPPRAHWHRYYGVLAPNSSPRRAVTAMAHDAAVVTPEVGRAEAQDLNAGAHMGTQGLQLHRVARVG